MPCPAPKVGGAVFACHVGFLSWMSVAVHSLLSSKKVSILIPKLSTIGVALKALTECNERQGYIVVDTAFR